MSDHLWQPSATMETLRRRTRFIDEIRNFFNARGYLEVETPIMGRYPVSDVYLSNIQARFRGETYYLQTSPEYAMKRLLAAGSGPIFQLARVFRDDELGRWHNPEFTMLEWYQLHIDHHELMKEVDALLQHILNTPPLVKKTYQQAFMDCCGIDPLTASIEALQQTLNRFELDNVLGKEESSPDQYLFLLMSHVVEPALAGEGRPVALYDFPSSQAALARVENGVAERFEIYYRGVELANGFHELTDADAQRRRFEMDQVLRYEKGLPNAAVDQNFLDALAAGLPPCSGVALGIDRLLALACQETGLSGVMAFDFSRA
ncbi:elongation factor P--(R)-beta-lysine ligase [Legionella spiritensis]|uniref:elongation factor P--(R)-beta-lysine ligase n=1 Tax=Legionella spiritensis TaxID=452 RepID=UPI000F6CAD22|nr:elongation factor P--(R)-beta-lysine ligase [Legionella spiritensis]VEG90720.1 lysyl-tRNA synthetase [Legionella spiritensis]